MLKRLKNVLLISVIVMVSLSSIVLAADDLPDVEENMTDDEIKTTAMMFYSAYLQDNSVKKEIKTLMDELQKKSDKKLDTYYSKTEYKNDNPVPNVMINKLNKLEDEKADLELMLNEAKLQAEKNLPTKSKIKAELKSYRNVKNESLETQRKAVKTFVKSVIIYENNIKVNYIVDLTGGGGPYTTQSTISLANYRRNVNK